MLMNLAAALALAGTWVPAVSPAQAAGPRPGHRVGIDILNVTGSGCQQGSAAIAMSPDNEAFTVMYSGYLAYVGAGAGRDDAHKDCRIKLRVNAVPGFTHTISSVDNRGFAILAPGATAEQLSGYAFPGSGQVPDTRHRFTGPYDDDWQITDRTDPAPVTFGACGAARNLDLHSELLVGAGTSDPAVTSMIAMDSTDGSLITTYHLIWRPC